MREEPVFVLNSASMWIVITVLCCSFTVFTDAGKLDDLVDDIACKMEEKSARKLLSSSW